MYFLKSYELFNNNKIFVVRVRGCYSSAQWRIGSIQRILYILFIIMIRNYFTESASMRSHKTAVQCVCVHPTPVRSNIAIYACAGVRSHHFIMNDIRIGAISQIV